MPSGSGDLFHDRGALGRIARECVRSNVVDQVAASAVRSGGLRHAELADNSAVHGNRTGPEPDSRSSDPFHPVRCLGEGRAAATVSVFGLATASIVHAIAAAFGLSALFSYSPVAFNVVKYCGAAYLVYLGISGLIKGGIAGAIARVGNRSRTSLVKIYWQGFLTDLLNPKLLLFFFSFLPQFLDPRRGEPWEQMLVLGLLFQVTGIPTNLAVAFAGGSIARWIARRPTWARIQNWSASALLIGLGVRLAFERR
jgi:threonine/homoserine/homoserine lactone efflux protein